MPINPALSSQHVVNSDNDLYEDKTAPAKSNRRSGNNNVKRSVFKELNQNTLAEPLSLESPINSPSSKRPRRMPPVNSQRKLTV